MDDNESAPELTEDERALVDHFGVHDEIDQAAPWPADEETATASAIVRHCAAVSLFYSAGVGRMIREQMAANSRGDEAEERYWTDAYIAAANMYVGSAQIAHVFVVLRAEAPTLADEIARQLVAYTEDGGLYGEVAWDWLTELGVNAEVIQRQGIEHVERRIAERSQQ